MVAQKTKNAATERVGSNRIEMIWRHCCAVDVALNTRNLRVETAAYPSRLSFTQTSQPNEKLKVVPNTTKTSQISQHAKDNPSVLRIVKIGSLLSRDLLTAVSVTYDITNREKPNARVPNEGNSRYVLRLMATRHTAATAKSAAL